MGEGGATWPSVLWQYPQQVTYYGEMCGVSKSHIKYEYLYFVIE